MHHPPDDTVPARERRAVGLAGRAAGLSGVTAAASAATPLLAELMERHGAELRRHLIGMLGREDDADDVLQEVWITVHERPPETGPGWNTRAWIFRVGTNAALSRLARDRRRRSALAARGAQLEPEREPPPDHRLQALTPVARARVRRQLARLPRKQRDAVWLRWVTGNEYRDIARLIGCSEDSARANVYQGMKKLRAELFDLYEKEYRE